MIRKFKYILTMVICVSMVFRINAQSNLPIAKGPFKGTDESLKQYKCPDWFRDAKFGIWAHWGVQAVPRHGDWYAKSMYQQGSSNYKNHLAEFGHPSKTGYKDIIPLWKAEKFDPDKLMAIYKKTGAKYFMSMGTHHDNFFLWDSKVHPWNSVQMGPHKDIVALWQKAAKKQGLRFGVSEHLAASYTWFQTSHGSDKTGPLAGVPYDGADPKYEELYHTKAAPDDTGFISKNPEWQKKWFASINELVDKYKPDILYSDSWLPFRNEYGKSMVANFYNTNIANNGTLEAIYTCKQPDTHGSWLRDLERGVMDSINAEPWQTDTSIGDWFYKTGQKYKTSKEITQMLVDIVSKNGNLLLNVVQTPEGEVEPDILTILGQIGKWMDVNGEGIYGSRPWKTFGEIPANAAVFKPGSFNEGKVKYSADDVRFTTKGSVLYAYILAKPNGEITIKSLGKNTKYDIRAIKSIKLLGSDENIKWKQQDDKLVISKPEKLPDWDVLGFKVEFN